MCLPLGRIASAISRLPASCTRYAGHVVRRDTRPAHPPPSFHPEQPCALATSGSASRRKRSSTRRPCLHREPRGAPTLLYSCTACGNVLHIQHRTEATKSQYRTKRNGSHALRTLILLEFPSGENSFRPSSTSTNAFQSLSDAASRSASSDMLQCKPFLLARWVGS